MARVAINKGWLVRKPGNGLDGAIDRVAREHGMSVSRGAQGLEMTGGSQVKMRFLGGWFTKDNVLPRWGALERTLEPGEAEAERITLRLEDRMGVGFMDPRIRRKYKRILESVAFSVEAALRENAADVRTGVNPGA